MDTGHISTETGNPPREENPRFSGFLLAILGICAVLYLLPFLLLHLPGFDRWGALDMEYGFTATGVNADVVILGDSSALFGIDPRQMSSELGLKVINLPNTLSTLPVTGDLELQHYLSTNTSPKLIVFYLAPWNLDYAQSRHKPSLFAGEEMLVRHYSAKDNLRFARSHFMEWLQMPFQFYASNPILVDAHHALMEPKDTSVADNLGHIPSPDTRHLAAPCKIPPAYVMEGEFSQTARALLDRYGSSQSKVMVFIAPIPSCGNSGDLLKFNHEEILAAPPKVLPSQLFVDDGYYAHLVPGEVPVATSNLIEAIRPVLGLASPSTKNISPSAH